MPSIDNNALWFLKKITSLSDFTISDWIFNQYFEILNGFLPTIFLSMIFSKYWWGGNLSILFNMPKLESTFFFIKKIIR